MTEYNYDYLIKKVAVDENGCWNWTGAVNHAGYPRIRAALKAHRKMYQVTKGEIPKDYHIHHSCKNRKCINPEHLFAVTREENYKYRKDANLEKTHCKYGHSLSGDNLIVTDKGFRVCRTCKNRFSKDNRKRMEALGYCTICQTNEPPEGYKTCKECRKRVAAHSRK